MPSDESTHETDVSSRMGNDMACLTRDGGAMKYLRLLRRCCSPAR